jgi:hypothetical protein
MLRVTGRGRHYSTAALNRIEKILLRNSGGQRCTSGQIIELRPDHCMTHDNTFPVMKKSVSEIESSSSPPWILIIRRYIYIHT